MALLSQLKSKIIFKPVNFTATNSAIKEMFTALNLPLDRSVPSPGVFNGKWGGNGPIIESVDPSTNRVVSKIYSASLDDFKETIKVMNEAKLIWREVSEI